MSVQHSSQLLGADYSTAENDVLLALLEVEDLHVPVSVVEMGMIYDIEVDGSEVRIEMTYPCMGCPAYEMMQSDVRRAVYDLEWIEDVSIDVVWDPVWSKDRLTEEAKRELALTGVEI